MGISGRGRGRESEILTVHVARRGGSQVLRVEVLVGLVPHHLGGIIPQNPANPAKIVDYEFGRNVLYTKSQYSTIVN